MDFSRLDKNKTILDLMEGTLKAKDIMTTDLFCVFDDDYLDIADSFMSWRRIRHVPVIDNENNLVGMVTHRDLLKASVSTFANVTDNERHKINARIPVVNVMSELLETVEPQTPLRYVAKIISEKKFGCIPVVQAKKLVGLITEADFVKLIAGIS